MKSIKFRGYSSESVHLRKSSLNKKVGLPRATAKPSSTITPSSGGDPLTIAKRASEFLKSEKFEQANLLAQPGMERSISLFLAKGSQTLAPIDSSLVINSGRIEVSTAQRIHMEKQDRLLYLALFLIPRIIFSINDINSYIEIALGKISKSYFIKPFSWLSKLLTS